jgi:hypothetical protein
VKSQWQETEYDTLLCSSSYHKDGHPAFNQKKKIKKRKYEEGDMGTAKVVLLVNNNRYK